MSTIVSLSKDGLHRFSKIVCNSIELVEGLGVVGDAHYGKTVKHRSRVKADPSQPNLRQVHLLHSELFSELKDKGFNIEPGALGENILTQGIDILSLPKNALLIIGEKVRLRITGLRNPCQQLNHYQKGLMEACLEHVENNKLIRKVGIMAVVEKGGVIRVNDSIAIMYPPEPHGSLERV